tara:strand:- start:451 stop:681 length:231 start_codon:yes stop_codon:yes gene_type:complete
MDSVIEVRNRHTLSVEEAAVVLGISRSYAYDMARRGKLPGVVRIGTRYLVSEAILLKFVDSWSSDEKQSAEAKTPI